PRTYVYVVQNCTLITPIDLEAPDLLLKSSNKPLKNLMISTISRVVVILAFQLLKHVDSRCKSKTERDIWKQHSHWNLLKFSTRTQLIMRRYATAVVPRFIRRSNSNRTWTAIS